jgi:hypothetical protein
MILAARVVAGVLGLILIASPGGAQSTAVASVEGQEVHFVHVRSRHAGALPLILAPVWAGSVAEQLRMVEPLVDPTAHGGRAGDAFHVVIPLMPEGATGWDAERTARAWDALMRGLGYRRYVAQGGDWGAFVMDPAGPRAPAGLLAIHTTVQPPARRPHRVSNPVAVTVFPGAPYEGRRRWTEQACSRLIYHVRGEQPADLARELRTAFASLR